LLTLFFFLFFFCFCVLQIQGDTIHVSNLAPEVTDEDVREIFERIGAVKSSNVNFNAAGQSTGTATVTFVKRADAERAVQEYDEAEVEGRVMRLKLIGTVVTAPVVVKKVQAPVAVAAAPQLFIPQPIQYQQFQQPIVQQRPQKAVVSRGLNAQTAR
jgi:RNA recognition motif-containing protein